MMESKMTDMMLDQNIRRLTETDINVLENAKSPPPSTPRDPLIDTINTTIEWERTFQPRTLHSFFITRTSVKFIFSWNFNFPNFATTRNSLVRRAKFRAIEK